MKIEGILHSGISVKNLEKSLEFYCDTLGFKVALPPCEFMNDEATAKAYGPPYTGHRFCTVEIREGEFIELIQYDTSALPHVDGQRPYYTLGAHHIAFLVDDIFEVKMKLEEKGIKFSYDPIVENDILWLSFNGPDGMIFELIQYIIE